VKYATVGGTAKLGTDFTAKFGTVTFAPNQTSVLIKVTVKGDVVDEANELFTVSLFNPVSATLADDSGQGTITDNDPTPTLSINDKTKAEGTGADTTVTFTVTLSAASGRQVTVRYATANDTATAPSDYVAKPLTTLTFAPGQTTKTITVTVKADGVVEPDQSFFVNLSTPVDATLSDSQGMATIVNDD
jgi:hypothetical protein